MTKKEKTAGVPRDAISVLVYGALLVVTLTAASLSARTVVLDFHDSVMVNDTLIYLRDIVKSVNAPGRIEESLLQTVVGEAAPPGYARYVNTAELFTYRLSSVPGITCGPARRIKVRTDHVERRVDDYAGLVMDYFHRTAKWPSGNAVLKIMNGNSRWKQLNTPVSVVVNGLDNPYPAGNCTIELVISQGARIRKVVAQCKVDVSADVVVASRAIPKGTPISPDMCEIHRKKITTGNFAPFTSISSLTGTRAKRTISAGTTLSECFVEKIPVVVKGEQIALAFSQGKVSVSVVAIARESGNTGETIWVENGNTRKLLRATITGKSRADVLLTGENSL